MVERSADEIQHDIEQARTSLAAAVDELTYRTSPKRLVDKTKTTVKDQLQTPQGKAVAGAVGGIVVIWLFRKIFRR